MARLGFGDMRAQFEAPRRDWMAIIRAWQNLGDEGELRRELIPYIASKARAEEVPILVERWLYWRDDPAREAHRQSVAQLIELLLAQWPAREGVRLWRRAWPLLRDRDQLTPEGLWTLLDPSPYADGLLPLFMQRLDVSSPRRLPMINLHDMHREDIAGFTVLYAWHALVLDRPRAEVRVRAERLMILGVLADLFYRYDHLPRQWSFDELEWMYPLDITQDYDELMDRLDAWHELPPLTLDDWPDVLEQVRQLGR